MHLVIKTKYQIQTPAEIKNLKSLLDLNKIMIIKVMSVREEIDKWGRSKD